MKKSLKHNLTRIAFTEAILKARNCNIEEHLVQLIEKKANLFMAYAQESAVKDSSSMASDPDTGSIERELMELMRAEEEEK